MQTNQGKLIVAAFPSAVQAKKAVDDLYYAGFPPEQVGILAPHRPPQDGVTQTSKLEDRATEGAVVGAVAGGVLGAGLGTLAVVTIPVFGAVVAGGIASAILGSTALGATVGSVLGPFVAMGLSEEEAEHYAGKFRRGQSLVFVRPDGREDEAIEIFRRDEGEVEIKEAAGGRPAPKG